MEKLKDLEISHCPTVQQHKESNGMDMKTIRRVFISASLIEALVGMVAFAAGLRIA